MAKRSDSGGSEKKASERVTVMVVDDDSDICVAVEMILKYEGFEVWTAHNGKQALARLDKERKQGDAPAIILTDVKMPEMDGITLLEALRDREDVPPVIMISGHGDIDTAVEAVKLGAVDFLQKPLDQNRLLVSIQNALRQTRLAAENTGLRRQLTDKWKLIGASESMERLRGEIARVADADIPVLITGENGTGKEVVARNLHLSSSRAGGPFVAVNCAAIPHELIESELFGHERGSFTGAHERRIGHFEAAHAGTLFLDEIGDMPLAAQAKVLRALETREITRVGATRTQKVDIRVIAATNADLAAAVEEKAFRLDLLYRLNVVPLRVPPLRERTDDIPILADHFLAEIGRRTGRRAPSIEADAIASLRSQPFPGNVRQLKNLIEAAHVFAEGAITSDCVQRILENGPALSVPAAHVRAGEDDPFQAETFEAFKNQSEALFFRRKLEENNGNVKRTSENLGMQRSHLYKKLDRYGLK